jgi:hypothetical protein
MPIDTGYPYHTIASLSEPIKSFVRHPSADIEISAKEVLLFLMSAGIQHGSNWYYWVDKNRDNPDAPARLIAALATGYDRVTYRALYALQLFNKDAVQKAIDQSPKDLRPIIRKAIAEHVFKGTVLSYLEEIKRSYDVEKAKKAAVVVREITNMCTTTPDFGKGDKKKVFISYNHKDADYVLKIKEILQGEEINFIIDTDYLRFGDNIKEFIERSVRESDHTLSVISKNSLLSPWVMLESLETLMHEHVHGKTKFLPLVVDDSFYQESFHFEAVKTIENGINELVDYIGELSRKGVTTTAYTAKMTRFIRLRNELDTVLYRLKENFSLDCTSNEKMAANLRKLCRQIQEG